VLRKKKFSIKFPKGKEVNGWFYLDDKNTEWITLAQASKYILPKTQKAMANLPNLDVKQFDELLGCPFMNDGYETIVGKVQGGRKI
jgi:hypothetical protein